LKKKNHDLRWRASPIWKTSEEVYLFDGWDKSIIEEHIDEDNWYPSDSDSNIGESDQKDELLEVQKTIESYVKKRFYGNGNIKEEYEVNEEGNMHGIFKVYHVNGQLQAHANFVNGIQVDGEITSYHDDGSKARKTTRLNGAFNGDFSEWHKNGNLKTQGSYVDGKIHGIYKTWDNENNQQKDFFKHGLFDFTEDEEIKIEWLQDIEPIYKRKSTEEFPMRILQFTSQTEDDGEYVSIFCSDEEEAKNIINIIIDANGGFLNYKSTEREGRNYAFLGHLFHISFKGLFDDKLYIVELNRIKHEFIYTDGSEILYGIHKESKKINSMIKGLNSLVYNTGEMASGDGRLCFTHQGSHIVSYWNDPKNVVHKFKEIAKNYPENSSTNLNVKELIKELKNDSLFGLEIKTIDFKITLSRGNSSYQMNIYLT
jgi:antitoxin component YwqK of YwqJK toxin-antitoxin module